MYAQFQVPQLKRLPVHLIFTKKNALNEEVIYGN